ncbi:hypothetical protein E3O53_04560 [Cryobacterium sp. TMT2-18-3]|nr:hypothetical protein E3O22_05115 [Cryobacterium sp. TMT2-18-2]TFC66085.1 hypothetical protein E3O53_04560 [Cryobacterium sp. TMT2-18-3]
MRTRRSARRAARGVRLGWRRFRRRGRCGSHPPRYPKRNLPHVGGRQGATERGVPHPAAVAAATLLGIPAEHKTVPWFWSDQADLELQIAGLSGGHDRVVLRGDPDSEKFSVLYYRGGTLIAADCINNPLDFMAVWDALHKGQPVPADAASDTSFTLKKLATGAPALSEKVTTP